jgi:hypothetical protein
VVKKLRVAPINYVENIFEITVVQIYVRGSSLVEKELSIQLENWSDNDVIFSFKSSIVRKKVLANL